MPEDIVGYSGGQTNLPSASSEQQQATAVGGTNVISGLMEEAGKIDLQARQLAAEAAKPIAGGHQLPGSFISPGPAAHPLYGMDTSPVVGHHNAQMRGIVNLSKGVSNLVAQVSQQQTQKKTQRLAVNIERLMGAVNSSDQADQILKSDPQNQAAQQQKQRATAVQDEILGDDKNRKAIEKAYNISFTDPSKNNTPEHAALKQATQSYAQQFQSKLPTQLGPDPQKVAQAQAAAAQSKMFHETIEKIAPSLITAQSTLEKTQMETQSRERIAEKRLEAAKSEADEKFRTLKEVANIHVNGALQARRMLDATMMADTEMRVNALSGADPSSPKNIQAMQKSLQTLTNMANSMETSVNQMMTNREAARKAGGIGGTQQALDRDYNVPMAASNSHMAEIRELQFTLMRKLVNAGYPPSIVIGAAGGTAGQILGGSGNPATATTAAGQEAAALGQAAADLNQIQTSGSGIPSVDELTNAAIQETANPGPAKAQ